MSYLDGNQQHPLHKNSDRKLFFINKKESNKSYNTILHDKHRQIPSYIFNLSCKYGFLHPSNFPNLLHFLSLVVLFVYLTVLSSHFKHVSENGDRMQHEVKCEAGVNGQRLSIVNRMKSYFIKSFHILTKN